MKPIYGVFIVSGEGLPQILINRSYSQREAQRVSLCNVGLGLPKGYSGTAVRELTDQDLKKIIGGC